MTESPNSRLLGALLALLAHDLRNPLSALHSNVGFLESLADDQDRDAREALADVTASCGSLKHIIDNLELLGLVVLGQGPSLERGPVGMLDVVEEVVSRMQNIADSYGVSVRMDGELARGLRVHVHRDMFARAFGNLLFNSIQHGGSSTPISIGISSDSGSGVILCSDKGAPLAPGLRTRAFTAEGQLSCKSDALGRYSRGLGLYSALIAGELGGADVRALEPLDGRNRFELRAPLAT
ncbi:MAG TPA: HAMP domain-containing sensor histidine kinase [Polyangiaceae bacterium]